MKLSAYLDFAGDCAQAIAFYTLAFQTPAPSIMYYKDAPTDPSHPIDAEIGNLVLHAQINFGEVVLMFSDVRPGEKVRVGNRITLMITDSDESKLRKMFDRLSRGGTIVTPFGPTHFSQGYGYLIDPYGVGWQMYLASEKVS